MQNSRARKKRKSQLSPNLKPRLSSILRRARRPSRRRTCSLAGKRRRLSISTTTMTSQTLRMMVPVASQCQSQNQKPSSNRDCFPRSKQQWLRAQPAGASKRSKTRAKVSKSAGKTSCKPSKKEDPRLLKSEVETEAVRKVASLTKDSRKKRNSRREKPSKLPKPARSLQLLKTP